MLRSKKIAVTGGVASGKTTVCQLFEKCGAYVVSADAIVHQLLTLGTDIGQQVVQIFGPEIVREDRLDRKKIAEIAFSHPELLHALENLTHPAVFEEIEKRYQQIEKEHLYPLFIAEIPLLYEARKEEYFDGVISVLASPTTCRKRSLDYDQRMPQQLPPEEKAARADFVIHNDGSLQQLEAQVKTIYQQLVH